MYEAVPTKIKRWSSGMCKMFYKTIELKFDKKIKALRPENGGEYVSQELHFYLIENGIESQSSSADTSE